MSNKVIWKDTFHTPCKNILDVIRNPMCEYLPVSPWGMFNSWNLIDDSIRHSVKGSVYIATCEWVRDSRNEYENSR